MKHYLHIVTLVLFAVAGLLADEVSDDPRIALDSAFPDRSAATQFSGEITLVEHVNRRGILRLDRDGTQNKYYWDLPHHFQMLPYGSIYFRGAPATLRDLPLGTHLHGEFFLGPEGEFKVDIPVTNYQAGKMARPDLRSAESQFSRVLRLEDDFTFYQRQGAGWKIISISDDRREMKVRLVGLPEDKTERTVRLNEGTQYWKGEGFGKVENLSVDQTVQINFGWITLLGAQKQDALAREIWIDKQSRNLATERQRGKYIAHKRLRGLPAAVIKTEHEPGKGAEGHATIQIHEGVDAKLIEEIRALKSIFVRPVLHSHRGFFTDANTMGHIKEIREINDPPAGSSGVQITFHIYEMFEGLRAGRTILIGNREWTIPEAPKEESMNPVDTRIFQVGPKFITDREGSPEVESEADEPR